MSAAAAQTSTTLPTATQKAARRTSAASTGEASTDRTVGYTAKNLSVLEGLEAVRKRPGMYIGSTDGRGLMHCVWEIVDNAVDEALGGFCTTVEVVLAADGSVEVRDNGRGIPVDVEPRTGLTGVELVLTKLHAGGKFGGGSYAASGGLHGVGASVVNALAVRLDVEVDRGGKIHQMSFRRGEPGVYDGDGPRAGFDAQGGLHITGTCKRTLTGTRVRWWSDPQVFPADAALDLEALRSRARQTAFLVPGLTIVVSDGRQPGAPVVETFHYEGGIAEYCEFLAPDSAVSDVLRLQGVGHFKETVPVLDDQGHLVSTEVQREMTVDIALRWGTAYDTVARSFVNIIATPKGGTHVAGFERAITKVVGQRLRDARVLRAAEPDVIKEDVLEGLTAVVTVKVPEPQFEGQTKEVLGTSAASRIVADVVTKRLGEILGSQKRLEKAMAVAILEKVAAAARTRIAARQHKELQRRKNALENSALPAKLADCRTEDVDRSELFIVEGDSALGTAKLARNSEFQALLPIRGKILNVQKASPSDMLKNTECAAIIQVIGAGSGRSFDLAAARYGRIVIMTDADVDGAHIRCLLLTLLYRTMRPLVDAGRVFAAMPPLHRLEINNPRKGQQRYIYTYTDVELRSTMSDLRKRNLTWKDPQRYKGLGEMDASQLAETTMDPGKRTLRRVGVADVQAAENVFELLMGNDVSPRRDFIIDGAQTLDRTRIDV